MTIPTVYIPGISCSLKPQKWGTLLTWQRSRRWSLTPSTKRVSHRGSLLKEVAVQAVLYQSILNAKLTGKKKLGRTMCTSNRDDRELENTVKQNWFKHLGELHKQWTEAGVSASSHHGQTSSGKGLPSPFWNRNIIRSILPGLKRKRTGLLLSDPKSSFQIKVNFAFHLEIYQEILEHFMLPSADKLYGDADFIFHTAKGTKSWFNDHGVTVLDWPTNSPDLNPVENVWGIVKRKMRDTKPNNADDLKAAIKATWASLHLSSVTGWLPPCHAALMQ